MIEAKKIVRAPDGGWGWFVVLGAFIVNVLVIGQLQSYGVIMIALLENLDTTQVLAQWVNGIAYAMTFLMCERTYVTSGTCCFCILVLVFCTNHRLHI